MNLNALLILGIALGLGLLSSYICKKTKMPQVIGQILIGVALGISGLKIFSIDNIQSFSIITELALGMIGFMIGGELRWARLKKVGIAVLSITFFESILSSLFVFSIIYYLTKSLPFALILGSLAAATAPGGTTNVIQEYRARGELTNTLLGVIGADDAFAIIIYTIMFNISKTLLTADKTLNPFEIINHVSHDILGAIIVGIILGIIFIFSMRFIKDNDAKQVFTLAFIFVCSGVAIHFGTSLILTNMTLGIIISNYHPHRARQYFNLVYSFTPSIYILFFVLVGARLQITLLPTLGLIGIAYIFFRVLGKISGAWLGGTLARAPNKVKNYLGICLLSQAGVALGLAISTQNELILLSQNYHLTGIMINNQDIGFLVINIITGTTFVFQLVGPLLTKYGLQKAGEIKKELYERV